MHKGLREEYGASYTQGDVVGCVIHIPEGGRALEATAEVCEWVFLCVFCVCVCDWVLWGGGGHLCVCVVCVCNVDLMMAGS